VALLNRTKSGQGQVIDASMVEGANYVGKTLNILLVYMLYHMSQKNISLYFI